MRWLTLALMGLCLILLQVIQYQATEMDELIVSAREHQAAVGRVEAQLAELKIEASVRNVLDAHDINVPRRHIRGITKSILEVSRHYDLEPELILAVIFTESSFNVHAESPKGAVGLMQLMPATALAVADELQLEWKGRQLLTDPQINILLGTSYLRYLMKMYDEQGLDYALAAYNVGPSRLDELIRERGHPPARYAEKVRSVSEEIRREFF
jgi:soluble lytic murein transglycosylase-like protein